MDDSSSSYLPCTDCGKDMSYLYSFLKNENIPTDDLICNECATIQILNDIEFDDLEVTLDIDFLSK